MHDALLHVNCIHHFTYGFGFSLIHWSAMCAFIPYSIAYVRMYLCPLYILMCYNKASILLLLISYSFILFPLLQYIYNCHKWIKPQAMIPFVRVTWVICRRILFDLIVLTDHKHFCMKTKSLFFDVQNSKCEHQHTQID